MHQRLLFFTIFVNLFVSASGQKNLAGNSLVLPSLVIDSFHHRFPSSQQVFWEKQEFSFVSFFVENKKDKQASFMNDGRWIETLINLDTSAILPQINRYVLEKYDVDDIKSYFEVDNYRGNYLSLEILADESIITLDFDLNGKFLREDVEPLEDEN